MNTEINPNQANNIISNCPLCEAHGLHILGEPGQQYQQCLNCGFVTSETFVGDKETNETYAKLPDEMKMWSKEESGRIWIPSMITLPFATLYPLDIDGEMKWAIAEMVDITEEEKENYPDGKGGFYKQRYDTENQTIYEQFVEAMTVVNEKAKAIKVEENGEDTTQNTSQ